MKKIKGKPSHKVINILAVSGGADSVYLLHRFGLNKEATLVAHVNHGARGSASEEDMRFVETMAKANGFQARVKRAPNKSGASSIGPAFEERARNIRYDFLRELQKAFGVKKIMLAHTADDQVETVLMRILEGAGISGLKGIPRKTADGVERPMLDTWREEILAYLGKHKIPYRVDKSNFDTRFERNWIRHVLIPLLEKRYGKSVKKRFHALGERFREIDDFLDAAARRWMKRNLKGAGNARTGKAIDKQVPVTGNKVGGIVLHIAREPFRKLPSALRIKILQITCFERVGLSPNERLLESMDRLIVSGGASARLNIGKRAVIKCRYEQAIVSRSGISAGASGTKQREAIEFSRKSAIMVKRKSVKMKGPGRYGIGGVGKDIACFQEGNVSEILWEEMGRVTQSSMRRIAGGEKAAVFDAESLAIPLIVRSLRTGDRLRPFGLPSEKRVKEILIDRKVPREERWGRPVVCDLKGTIIWIPGVIRSAIAPVTSNTRRVMVLRLEFDGVTGNNQ